MSINNFCVSKIGNDGRYTALVVHRWFLCITLSIDKCMFVGAKAKIER